MPDLATIANYAEIIGVGAVLFAIIFAFLEFRQLRFQRRENASLEMMRAWQGPEYVNAIYEILQVDDHVEPEVLRAMGGEHELMAFRVCMTFEALGVMAYRGSLPIEVVNDLMGGAVCSSWRKLDRWVLYFRENYNSRAFEWCEWLAHRLESMPTPDIAT